MRIHIELILGAILALVQNHSVQCSPTPTGSLARTLIGAGGAIRQPVIGGDALRLAQMSRTSTNLESLHWEWLKKDLCNERTWCTPQLISGMKPPQFAPEQAVFINRHLLKLSAAQSNRGVLTLLQPSTVPSNKLISATIGVANKFQQDFYGQEQRKKVYEDCYMNLLKDMSQFVKKLSRMSAFNSLIKDGTHLEETNSSMSDILSQIFKGLDSVSTEKLCDPTGNELPGNELAADSTDEFVVAELPHELLEELKNEPVDKLATANHWDILYKSLKKLHAQLMSMLKEIISNLNPDEEERSRLESDKKMEIASERIRRIIDQVKQPINELMMSESEH